MIVNSLYYPYYLSKKIIKFIINRWVGIKIIAHRNTQMNKILRDSTRLHSSLWMISHARLMEILGMLNISLLFLVDRITLIGKVIKRISPMALSPIINAATPLEAITSFEQLRIIKTNPK